MLKIGIFDTDDENVNKLVKIIKSCTYKSKIIRYKSVDSLVTDADFELDAFISGIDIYSNLGFDAAEKLAKLNPELKIIFFTEFAAELVQDIFLHSVGLKPFALIKKPAENETVSRIIAQLGEISDNYNDKIHFKLKSKEYIIPVNEVIYAESIKRKAVIHTLNNEYECYKKLTELCTDEIFVFTHKSFAVNMAHIKSYGGSEVIMDSGKLIPISRSCKASFLKKIYKFKQFCEQT